MLGKKKKAQAPVYDVTQKIVRTCWGGTKPVPTTKAEEQKMKADVLKCDPNAKFFDSAAKKKEDLEWIDRIEEFDAFMN